MSSLWICKSRRATWLSLSLDCDINYDSINDYIMDLYFISDEISKKVYQFSIILEGLRSFAGRQLLEISRDPETIRR